MAEDKSNFALIAIVAIVAIIALVVLFKGTGTKAVESKFTASAEGVNFVGEAGNNPTDPSGCRAIYNPWIEKYRKEGNTKMEIFIMELMLQCTWDYAEAVYNRI